MEYARKSIFSGLILSVSGVVGILVFVFFLLFSYLLIFLHGFTFFGFLVITFLLPLFLSASLMFEVDLSGIMCSAEKSNSI